jgi:hypothetical protein
MAERHGPRGRVAMAQHVERLHAGRGGVTSARTTRAAHRGGRALAGLGSAIVPGSVWLATSAGGPGRAIQPLARATGPGRPLERSGLARRASDRVLRVRGGHARAVPAAARHVGKRTAGGDRMTDPSLSPDGRGIALASVRGLPRVPLDRGSARSDLRDLTEEARPFGRAFYALCPGRDAVSTDTRGFDEPEGSSHSNSETLRSQPRRNRDLFDRTVRVRHGLPLGSVRLHEVLPRGSGHHYRPAVVSRESPAAEHRFRRLVARLTDVRPIRARRSAAAYRLHYSLDYSRAPALLPRRDEGVRRWHG